MAGIGYGILRVEKIKLADGGGLRGRAMHDFRQFKGYGDTSSNEYEGCQTYEELRKKAGDRWATLTGKPRSDAVGMLEVMVTTTAGHLPKEREEEFFASVRREVEQWYGAENVLAMAVHRDETTPHCHIFVAPIERKAVKKNRLSKEEKERVEAGEGWPTSDKVQLNAKKLLDGKESLSRLQTNFHVHVFRAFGLERGEISVNDEEKKKNVRSNLKKKEHLIDTLLDDVKDRQHTLTQQETNFIMKESQVKKRDEAVAAREAKVLDRENAVKAREEAATARETALEGKLEHIVTQNEALEKRKAALDKKEADLKEKARAFYAEFEGFQNFNIGEYVRLADSPARTAAEAFLNSGMKGNWEDEKKFRGNVKTAFSDFDSLIERIKKVLYALTHPNVMKTQRIGIGR